ncbi:DUF3299 domain-containing protein [Vibrio sp. VB16]|uniref:DUF3299 domain-containing protein n=1 Tax=Vibrio sp. VB16 TaxID=2785746 RepID=UPI00189F65B4|nr:DUF3299 domain-containing protein [Vibrio sp. VB16]UGA55089.1 DUF3299 domain-containing protein [Vibrio sp. VB16]
MKNVALIVSLLSVFLIPIQAVASGESSSLEQSDILQLEWIDLIPENERNLVDSVGMPLQLSHEEDSPEQSKLGGVRQELNGSIVKIPGFVIPLEGDENMVTEFMLVPFLGACIHVPPPPPNQLIYVRFKGGAPVQELWDVVYIVGRLKTETVSHELAEVGYVIEGMAVEVYDDQ